MTIHLVPTETMTQYLNRRENKIYIFKDGLLHPNASFFYWLIGNKLVN